MVKRCLCILGLCLFSLPSVLPAADRTDKIGSIYPISIELNNDLVIAALMSDSPDPVSFGRVPFNSSNLSNQLAGKPRFTIHYNGYDTIDYAVKAEISGGWTLGATIGDVGVNKCVIAGIFTAPVLASELSAPYGRDLVVADFDNNDVLGNTPTAASLSNLFADNGADPFWMSGYSVSTVPTGSTQRSMRFLFQTPTIDSTGTTHTIFITFLVAPQ